jgi:hypothetical protein
MLNVGDLKDFTFQWNFKFPVDRWWRKKHSIPFNSPDHREISFIDQYFEFIEDSSFTTFINRKKEEPYVPGKGNFLK